MNFAYLLGRRRNALSFWFFFQSWISSIKFISKSLYNVDWNFTIWAITTCYKVYLHLWSNLLHHTVVKYSSQNRHTPLGYAHPEIESAVRSKGHTQTEGRDMQVHEASSTMLRHNREATVICKDEQEVWGEKTCKRDYPIEFKVPFLLV